LGSTEGIESSLHILCFHTFSGGNEGVRSRFLILCSRTRFGRKRGRQVLFSCFALPDPIWAELRALNSVFIFLAPGLISVGAEDIGYHFHVPFSRTSFQQYRGRRDPFSCFALPNPRAELRATSQILMVLAPGLVFSGTRGVRSYFLFCTPGLIFEGTEDVGSSFHVSRSRTHFQRYRGRQVPFSCVALLDLFCAVHRAAPSLVL
jgi:hypothetical protein